MWIYIRVDCTNVKWFKAVVLGVILICLSSNVRINQCPDEEVDELAMFVRRMGKALNYTELAINRVIDAIILSDAGEESVLMLAGALYRTKEQRLSSGDTRQYNVRMSFKIIVETNTVNTTTWETFDEDKLTILRQQIESQFPKEAADIIVNMTREHSNSALMCEQREKSATDFLLLLFDGATAINTGLFSSKM